MREYLLVLCVAAAVTYLLTPLARRFALRIGAMAEPRDRDVHAIATPRLGGLAMYAGVCAAFLVAHQLPALSGVFTYSDVQAVTVGGGLIVLLGLVDDKWGIDALTKLGGQVVAVGVMVLLGLQLLTLTLPGISLSLGPEGVPLTVLLALLTINAINFIDGLDGLAAEGMRPVTGGTDTHLALLDLQGIGVSGKDAEARCDRAGIVVNKNAIPYDPQPASIASGVRVGTPAVTTQGMTEGDMKEIGSLIGRAVRDADGSAAAELREGVTALVAAHPAYGRASGATQSGRAEKAAPTSAATATDNPSPS